MLTSWHTCVSSLAIMLTLTAGAGPDAGSNQSVPAPGKPTSPPASKAGKVGGGAAAAKVSPLFESYEQTYNDLIDKAPLMIPSLMSVDPASSTATTLSPTAAAAAKVGVRMRVSPEAAAQQHHDRTDYGYRYEDS